MISMMYHRLILIIRSAYIEVLPNSRVVFSFFINAWINIYWHKHASFKVFICARRIFENLLSFQIFKFKVEFIDNMIIAAAANNSVPFS